MTVSPEVLGEGRGARRRRRRVPVLTAVALVVLAAVVVALLLGSLVTPHDPDTQDLVLGAAGRSGEHWLGTDELGRDVLSRLIVGTRAALIGPLVVALLTLCVGAPLGLAAGYFGGRVDGAISRFADVIWALPALLVAIVVLGVVDAGYWLAVAVIAFLSLPHMIRLSRSATLVQARLPYVDAVRTLGLSSTHILARHVFPNVSPTILATFLLDFVGALIVFSSLAFLGIGIEPGSSDWGTMLAAGRELLFVNPWLLLGPGIAIVVTAASITLIGDWMYERMSERGA
jgi:peptide/nickel transport system permease protein/glutathione transport system permease protein